MMLIQEGVKDIALTNIANAKRHKEIKKVTIEKVGHGDVNI